MKIMTKKFSPFRVFAEAKNLITWNRVQIVAFTMNCFKLWIFQNSCHNVKIFVNNTPLCSLMVKDYQLTNCTKFETHPTHIVPQLISVGGTIRNR